MEATENEVSEVFEWLQASHSIRVDVEWLEACISWLKQQNSNPITKSQLEQQVYEQWLLSDLRESGVSRLPPQMTSIAKTQIADFLPLQANFVVNISESAYSQLKKLKKENLPESLDTIRSESWQPKANRMLMLDLTDGYQTVKGMEYKPIKELHSDLIPGTKVLIKRGTLCRMGVIFLTENDIKILGGQVGDIIEENSQMNVLKRLVGEDVEIAPVPEENGRQNATENPNEQSDTPSADTAVFNEESNITEEDIEALLNDDDSFDDFLAIQDAWSDAGQPL